MVFKINFSCSRVPCSERDIYLKRLQAITAKSKWQKAGAYRDRDSADWVIIIWSQYPCMICADEINPLLRSLKGFKCHIWGDENAILFHKQIDD